jgi:hypothetical protein
MEAGTPSDDEQALLRLNERFAEAEKGRDEDFFRSVLADDLVFRRANGTRVGKTQYLQGLVDARNRYDRLEAENVPECRSRGTFGTRGSS